MQWGQGKKEEKEKKALKKGQEKLTATTPRHSTQLFLFTTEQFLHNLA
jgi:hypothetical protein